jgi:hypothetical protein
VVAVAAEGQREQPVGDDFNVLAAPSQRDS